ncbi:hypothetical protein KRP22_012246 [Phytophthora ramorum]|nr:hypothetical protein KRP22_14950 [Phytophthora ramorum]
MKFSRFRATLALLWLSATPLNLAFGDTVSVHGSFDDSHCTIPSTVSITEGCRAYQSWETYYAQEACSDSRDAYLKSTYGDSALFMIEYYEDIDCGRLSWSEVYLVDGECHNFTMGNMRMWASKDKSLAAVLGGSCGSESLLLNMNFSVNTGACVPQSEYDKGCEAFDGDYLGGRLRDSRESYLQSTFGNTSLFVVEYFNDNKCGNLIRSDVYLADGQCHNFTQGVMKVLIGSNDSMAEVLYSESCDSGDWDAVEDHVATVDPVQCIVENKCRMTSMRYALINVTPGLNATTGASAASSHLHSQLILGVLVWAAVAIAVQCSRLGERRGPAKIGDLNLKGVYSHN